MQRTIPAALWLLAGVLVAGALGRHAVSRLFIAAEELSLGAYVFWRFDRADVMLMGVFLAAAILPAVRETEPRPWGVRAAALLGLAAVFGLPRIEDSIARLGRQAWGYYGDRVAAGIECGVVLALAAALIVLAARFGERRWTAAAIAVGAACAEALLPRVLLVPAAAVAGVAAITLGARQ